MTGLVIEYQRQMASSATGMPRSRSMSPIELRWATWPCRATSTWHPAILPGSTYFDRRCSSIRARRAGSNPAAFGSSSIAMGGDRSSSPRCLIRRSDQPSDA